MFGKFIFAGGTFHRSINSCAFFFWRAGFPASMATHPRGWIFQDDRLDKSFHFLSPIQDILILVPRFFQYQFRAIFDFLGSSISGIGKQRKDRGSHSITELCYCSWSSGFLSKKIYENSTSRCILIHHDCNTIIVF